MIKTTASHGSILSTTADTLIVSLFEGVDQLPGATSLLDAALNGAIHELLTSGDVRGKAGEVGILYPRGVISAQRVLVVGLGKPEDLDLDGVRKAAAAAIKRARDLNAKSPQPPSSMALAGMVWIAHRQLKRPLKDRCWRFIAIQISNQAMSRKTRSNRYSSSNPTQINLLR